MSDPIQKPPIENSFQTAIEHAQRMAEPLVAEASGFMGKPVMLCPPNWSPKEIAGWEYEVPQVAAGSVQVATVGSFVEYFNRYKLGDNARAESVVFIHQDYVVGVIDYHRAKVDVTKTVPGGKRHTVVFRPKPSPAWLKWSEINKTGMSQQQFATFLEDNLGDVVEPAGADLLEMINVIAVDESVTLRSAQRLASGSVKFAYANESTAKCGELEFPTRLVLSLPIYRGAPVQNIAVRFKYRLQGGKFSLWFEIPNPELILENAFQAFAATVRNEIKAPIYDVVSY